MIVYPLRKKLRACAVYAVLSRSLDGYTETPLKLKPA
jgi:hypothetical protein